MHSRPLLIVEHYNNQIQDALEKILEESPLSFIKSICMTLVFI